MKTLIVLLLTLSSCLAETLPEIRGLMQDHAYARAETALQAGLHEHPKSALGWYYLAQDEYFLGKYPSARAALATAEALDPQLSFTHNPQEFYHLQQQLNPGGSTTVAPTYSSPSPLPIHNSFNFGSLLMAGIGIVLVIAVLGWIFSLFQQRTNYVRPDYSGNLPPTPPPTPYPSYPGYQQPGSGVGTFLGGMAAGALADELLRPREEIIREEVIDDRSVNNSNNDPLPFDPGNTNQDWSSNDSSSGFDGGSSSDQNNW